MALLAQKISIIIPTRNEADTLPMLLCSLNSLNRKGEIAEIIICDGRSDDHTTAIAQSQRAKVITSSMRQRATQMNLGATIATGEILYFLHADSIPPRSLVDSIMKQVNAGYESGCFRLKFDFNHWFLRMNAWFTRFSFTSLRFGDQSLYITKELFNAIGGFDEKLFLMEDQEIIIRVRKKAKFIVIPEYITTSAKKYKINGVLRLQFIFYTIYLFYKLGFSQYKLKALYKKWIQ